jgi:hypothetical protein
MRLLFTALAAMVIAASPSVVHGQHCHKGIPCGNACISATKVCRVEPGAATASGSSATTSRPSAAVDRPRDEHGRFIRNASARARFMRLTGYPSGRPGYIVDHIIPLACGGPDTPENMQWQTLEEAKVKDRYERAECTVGRQ